MKLTLLGKRWPEGLEEAFAPVCAVAGLVRTRPTSKMTTVQGHRRVTNMGAFVCSV